MVCEKILLLHFKSGKISVIIFLGPLLMELHLLFMNGHLHTDRPLSQPMHHIEKFRGTLKNSSYVCFFFLQFDISIFFVKMFVRFKTMLKIHGMAIKILIKHITDEFKETLAAAGDISQC